MKNFLAILLFIVFETYGIGQTSLEYRLKIGDVFVIKQNAEQIITQKIEGASHAITNTIDGVLEFKVIGEREDHYIIELTFEDLNLNMSSSIQGELMSVRAKEVVEDDMQSQIFNTLLHNPVQITLAKTGDIFEVKGGNSLVTKMANASGLEDEFSLNLMKKSLEKEFGSEALSNNYKQMTYIYPTTKIKVGDTWKNEYDGKLVAKNVWKLDGLTAKNASISGKAQVRMDVKEPATTMLLSGTQETMITTDIATGFILKMTVNGTSNGISTIAQIGDQEIPTTIKSTITYELINKYYVQ